MHSYMMKVRSEESLNRKYIAVKSHRKRQTRGKQSFELGCGGGWEGGEEAVGMPPVRRSK